MCCTAFTIIQLDLEYVILQYTNLIMDTLFHNVLTLFRKRHIAIPERHFLYFTMFQLHFEYDIFQNSDFGFEYVILQYSKMISDTLFCNISHVHFGT